MPVLVEDIPLPPGLAQAEPEAEVIIPTGEVPNLILPRHNALVFTRATRSINEPLEARWRGGRWQFLVSFSDDSPSIWIEEFNGDWLEVQTDNVATR